MASILPLQIAAFILFLEAIWSGLGVRRYRHLAKCHMGPHRTATTGTSNGEDNKIAHSGLVAEGLQVLQRLLDPEEAHAELLRTTAWLDDWWHGVSKTNELGLGDISDFLSSILGLSMTGVSDVAAFMRQMSLRFIETLGLDISIHDRWISPDSGGYFGTSPEINKPTQELLVSTRNCSKHDQPGEVGSAIASRNPRASLIADLRTPLKASYRPMYFYALTEAVAGISHVQMTRRMGFKLASKTSIAAYYVRKPPSGQPQGYRRPPIVFLHGIGLGLSPYTAFLRTLKEQHPDRTIVAVQYKHVSMRLTARIPTAVEVADDVATFLQSWGFAAAGEHQQNGAEIVGHSYGTLVASALSRRHASLIAGLTLIDPVCFAMFLPHLVRKTLHLDAFAAGHNLPTRSNLRVEGNCNSYHLDDTIAACSHLGDRDISAANRPRTKWQPIRSLMKGNFELNSSKPAFSWFENCNYSDRSICFLVITEATPSPIQSSLTHRAGNSGATLCCSHVWAL